MNNSELNNNYGNLKAVVKISWFILPVLILQIILFYTSSYELHKYQHIIILICIGFFCVVNLFKKQIFLVTYFYYLQAAFLFILLLFEFLWYADHLESNQLFSFILGITITGLALLKAKNTIIYFIILILTLLVVNYLNSYPILNYVNYFFISAVVITGFNIWRATIFSKIEDSENSYRSIFNDAESMIFIVDQNKFNIIEYNNSATKYLVVKDVKGKNFIDVFTCDNESDKIRTSLEETVKSQKFGFVETLCSKVESENIPKEYFFRPSVFFKQKVIVITVKLIKERKEKERQLRESKENITQILDNINSFVYNRSFHDNGDIIVKFISKKAQEVLGIALEDLVVMFKTNRTKELIHENDLAYVVLKNKEANETLKPQIIEYRITVNNEIRWIEEKIFPKREENCFVHIGIITDITLQKTNELKIILSEQKYRQLYNESMAGFFRTNLDGDIIEANQAFAVILGIDSVEELKTMNIKDFYYSDFDRENYLIHLKKEKALRNYLIILKKANGQKVIVSNNVFYVRIDNISQITGTLVDVTELHETTEALKRNELKLIESQNTFKNIIDSSPSALLIFNDENNLVFLNKVGKSFYETYLNSTSKVLEEIFDKKHRFLIENVIKENSISTKSYTEIIFTANGIEKIFVFQVVKVVYESSDSNLLLFRDVTLEQQYNSQKLRAELAEEINVNLEEEIERHKNTQKLLVENTKFTENVLDSSLDMIIASSKEGLITSINSASLKRLGYEREELLGKNINLLYSKDDKSNEVFDSINSTEKYIGEIENVDKFGNTFKSFLSATTIKNNEGEVLGYMGVSRDLSEIEEIKKIISDQSSLIDSLFKNEANVFIWIINKNMDLVSFNNSTNNYFKLINETSLIKGKNFLTQINNSIRKEHKDSTKLIYENALNGEKIEFEALMFDKSGKKYWIDVHLSPVITPNGEIQEVVCLGHDITDKKEKTRIIEENESNIRAVINAIPDMLFKVSKTGEIIDYEINSEEQKQIFNEFLDDQGDLSGQYIQNLFDKNPDEDFPSNMIEKINKTIESELVLTQNFDYYYNDVLIHFENRYSKVNNNEAIIVIRNRTEEIENEQKLIESVHEKEVLLKEVHHRVKNNLQIINSILNLQSSYVSDEKTLEIINESQNRIRSMAYIHESLYQTNNFSSINFKDYIENLISNLIFSYQIGDSITLVKSIQPIDLALDQAIPCGLILNEIITNALKYAYPSSEKGDIIIDISESNKKIEIVVEDFGVGLPNNFNIETSESLGLSLVHTLVDQIDGELIVKSDGGTKFLIIFEMLES